MRPSADLRWELLWSEIVPIRTLRRATFLSSDALDRKVASRATYLRHVTGMTMIGPLSPTIRCNWSFSRPLRSRRSWSGALIVCSLVVAMASSATAAGEPLSVKLRLLWGAGGATTPLTGSITADGGALSELQPLGLQVDEAAAVQLRDGRVLIQPLLPRRFDGCDLLVTGDRQTKITVQLNAKPSDDGDAPPVKEFVTTLGEVANQPLRETIAEDHGYLMIQRTPGDQLRVELERDSLVFSPSENWQLRIHPDLPPEVKASRLEVTATIRKIGEPTELWQQSLTWDAAQQTPLSLQVPCPAAEAAYELILTAKEPTGFAKRFLPGVNGAPLLQRSIGFVVIDPDAALPRLTEQGVVELSIDPTNARWWQRLPQWARLANLSGVSAPRPLGNVDLEVRTQPYGRVAALAATPEGEEPHWQAYTLPVREIGVPHAIEIELPQGRSQHLAISLIEPDAAGRVEQFGRDTGYYDEPEESDKKPKLVRRRLVFWPKSKSPVLLLANRSSMDSAEYGNISLLRLEAAPASLASEAPHQRTIAAYLTSPQLAEFLGAQQSFDSKTGLSIDSWQTQLQGIQRVAQQLRAGGYNTLVMTIAAEGSSLSPIPELGNSPRFESGRLTAADPIPKDVLEALLRVFDREGLRLVPAVQLSAPLPALEGLLVDEAGEANGVLLVGPEGRTWDETFPDQAGHGPRYNLLNQAVQNKLQESLLNLADRYAAHPSFAGIAVQLSGQGYAMLPGLKWGLDDETMSRFADDVGVAVDPTGSQNDANRFQRRARLLTTETEGQRANWIAWRQTAVTDFYEQLAVGLKQRRSDLQLTLCTEELVSGPELSAGIQRAAAGRTTLSGELAIAGIDLERLRQADGVNLLRPRRFDPSRSGQQQALAKHLNTATDLDRVFARQVGGGAQVAYVTEELRLPTFDQQSPFNPATTYLNLTSSSAPTGTNARQYFVTALSLEDSATVVTDLRQAVLGDDPALRELFQTIAELPPPTAEARTEHRQPLTMRVYREEEATSICLINTSPWSIEVALPLTSAAAVDFRSLGKPAKDYNSALKGPSAGVLASGKQRWSLQLDPYELRAWRFADKRVRIESPTVELSSPAIAALNARIDDLEQRMRSLDIRRSYEGLKSPGFEAIGETPFDSAWQLRLGRHGMVDFKGKPHTGDRALRLMSEDSLGVAAESNSFEVPNTGRLALRSWYRAIDADADARLHLSIEYEVPGGVRRLYKSFGASAPLAGDWSPCEFVVDEIAAAEGAQMRVQFHLTGRGQVTLDDVELYDLQFDRTTRIELAKQVYAARTALEQRRVMDCLELVDGYWPRYLMSNVPPAAEAYAIEPTPTDVPGEQEESPRLTERIRHWTPRLWR